jgi:acyl-CoA synthetase (AMP-forming)/AMP-acid ligase II
MLRGHENQLIDPRTGESLRWSQLPSVQLEPPIAAIVDSSFDALPYVYAHAQSGSELLILAASRLEPALRADLLGAGFNLVDASGTDRPDAADRRPSEPDRLWLLTSGSTGRPKRIGHTLTSLSTISKDQAARRWLCPYSPGTYAWWQLITLGLTQPEQDLVVVDPADLEQWVQVGIEYGITAASGTPTFWRQTIMQNGHLLGEVPLRQITLGGEPVDQAVLDQLRTVFPEARISWIYASSEVGASVIVHDGKAGFPETWLNRPSEGRPTVSVVEDELVITSPHHGLGLDGPVRTGDRAVIADGRVLITGRLDSDEINVGGAKVSAGIVRDVLQSHPGVAWANVRGRKAPMVGTIVVADVVLRPGDDEDETAMVQQLTDWCRDHLPDYGVPRFLRVLDTIPAKETLKSDV